jgi:lyso-ornithine lipid O-acyltransferase
MPTSPLSRRLETAARKSVRVAGFVGFTGLMVPLYVARDRLAPASQKVAVRDRWLKRWSGTLLRLFGVRVTFSPPFPALAVGGRLVVSNHRSAIDVGILLVHFGGHMVSRADLAKWPIVGAAARSVDTVFVDRSSTVSRATTIRSIRDLLRKAETVLLFPEGTTFAGDEVRPFQAGAFIAPLKTKASIVPVGIAYAAGSDAAFVGESFVAHLARMAGGKPTHVVVHIGEPIDVTPASRAADLAERARDAVQRLVESARREAEASAPG